MAGVTSAADARSLRLGTAAWYRGGGLIGPVTGLYLDEATDQPAWVAVATERLLPLSRAALGPDGRLLVALPDLAVELSPPLDPGAVEFGVVDEERLHGYYAAVLDGPGVRPAPLHRSGEGGTARLRRYSPSSRPVQRGGPARRGDRTV